MGNHSAKQKNSITASLWYWIMLPLMAATKGRATLPARHETSNSAGLRRLIPSYLLLALISIFVISGLSVSGKAWADTVYQRTTAHSFGSNYNQLSSTAGGAADVTSTLCNAARCTANSTYLFYPGADHNTSNTQTTNPQRGWATINPINGTIPAGTWTFRWAVEVQQFTTGGTATVSARVFRATNGTSGTLLFTVSGSRNYATTTSAAVAETINSAQTAYSLAANEYLVVEYWMSYNATGDYAFRLQSNTANNYVIYPPPQTTLGTGTDPSNTSLAPGGTSTLADAFSFQTSSGTDIITAATVTFAAGSAGGLALVEITNVAGTTVYGSVTNPGSDTPTITLSTNTLTATTTLTEYRIRITPKTHANMPAPPGSSYAVTARISAFTSTNGQTGSDTAGTTVTIDNLSPGNVTAATATASSTQVSLAWTNPVDADFHSIVVLRRATSAVADVPVEGSTYTVGNTIGTATVACVVAVAGTSCNDTGLTNGTAYHYKIFAKDSNGNYSATGVVPTGSPATPMVTVSGTVYIDEGVTTIADGATVRLLINGASAGTATTTGGAYSIPLASINANDAILVYIDNHATYKGITVSITNGAAMTGFNIYAGHMITRHDNGGALTNTNMSTAKGGYVDTDILYSVSAGNLVVTSGYWLYILAGHSYTPGGNVTTTSMNNLGIFNGGSGNITVQGTLIQSAGTYTATSGTTSISASFTVSGGTFIHNSGTIFMTSTGWRTYNIGTTVLNNFTIAIPSAAVSIVGTIAVNGNLNITGGEIVSGTLAVAGNVTTTHAGVAGGAMILLNGTGNQILSASGGTGALPGVTINKASGTLTIQDTINIGGTEGWTYTAGTVDAGTSTVGFTNTTATTTVSAGAMSFNNVDIAVSGMTLNVTGTLDVNGNFNITSAGALGGGAITVAGNLSSVDTSVSGTATITLDGSGAQSINTTGAGDLPNGTLTINKASGVATLTSHLTLNSAGQDLTITQGTLDLAGYNLTLTATGDVLTVDAAGTLQLQGGETVSASTRTFNAGSTVIYNGGVAYASLPLGNSYSNLTFNGAGSWTHTGALTANNLTITAGTLISGGQNINFSGNWSNSGSYTSGANTVTLNGANQNIIGSTTFNNLSKSVAAADTLTFEALKTTTINGTVTLSGAAGQLLTLASSTGSSAWGFALNASAIKAISYVSVSWSDASGSHASQKPIAPSNSTDGGNNIAWFTVIAPSISVLKSSTLISDPVNGGTTPLHLPGAILSYQILTTNSGTGSPDANTVVVTDALDSSMLEYDVTTGIIFTANTSGLTLGTVSYAHTATPTTYTYTPTGPYDPNVAGIKVTTSGAFATGGANFTISFRVRIK